MEPNQFPWELFKKWNQYEPDRCAIHSDGVAIRVSDWEYWHISAKQQFGVDIAYLQVTLQEAAADRRLRLQMDIYPANTVTPEEAAVKLMHPNDMFNDPDRGWDGTHQIPAYALLQSYTTMLDSVAAVAAA